MYYFLIRQTLMLKTKIGKQRKRFLNFPIWLLSLSVCSKRKYSLYFVMAKLNSKKNRKNLCFTKKKVW